jgi:aminoglycoside/choline kinase family phosphotransferase
MSLLHSDQRITALVDWLSNSLAMDIHKLETASSDASFRRYFRVTHTGGQHIVMDAPPEKENIAPFIRIAELLHKQKIPVPSIYQKNIDQGFLLLEDFGSTNLLDCLTDNNADHLYQIALDTIFKLQTSIDTSSSRLPVYDAALLQRELDIFYEWFMDKLLGVLAPESIKNQVNPLLIASALEQPQVFVHRDFHSRNLMLQDNGILGVIDFQDAVIGPISYDLVSLLRDCYINWPQPQVEQWLRQYYARLSLAEILTVDFQHFRRWFDFMGLQRHLKAIGIFSRLHLRDGKSTYLADIPRTLNYITTICASYSELAEFNSFLAKQVLPIYRGSL